MNSKATNPSRALVKRRRFRLGGGDQLHMPVIECVDQRDETLGLVAPLRANDRDRIEDHGMEPPRDRQKIGGAERHFAKIGKCKARHIGAGLRHMNRMAEHIEGDRRAARRRR